MPLRMCLLISKSPRQLRWGHIVAHGVGTIALKVINITYAHFSNFSFRFSGLCLTQCECMDPERRESYSECLNDALHSLHTDTVYR